MRQQVEGTGGRTHGARGQLEVPCRGRHAAMSHQQLDPADISTRFEQMRGERVSLISLGR